jgi:hypothetical protein
MIKMRKYFWLFLALFGSFLMVTKKRADFEYFKNEKSRFQIFANWTFFS